MLNHNKAQHLAEYALIFSLILAALIAMQTYVKRGLQGRYRDAADHVVSALRAATGDSGLDGQYEPYYAESEFTIITGTPDSPNTVVREFFEGSETTRTDRITKRDGRRKILPLE